MTDAKHVKKFKKLTALLCVTILLAGSPAIAIPEAETVAERYSGLEESYYKLKSINYDDIQNSWAKQAIYEAGALGVLVGEGNGSFGADNLLTREEAIALAYNMSGRWEDISEAAEKIETEAQNNNGQGRDLEAVDAYLQLAADEGLISEQDLEDAFAENPAQMLPESFNRKAPAERQEIAFWIAKALKLEPDYLLQSGIRDMANADPVKAPYIRAVYKSGIMSDDGNGNFMPTLFISKEQAAQVVKNAQTFILPALKMEKKTGTVENISQIQDYSSQARISKITFDIRNSSGKLHQIEVEVVDTADNMYRNEQNGSNIYQREKDIPVYKDDMLGGSSLLKIGDRIEYIVETQGARPAASGGRQGSNASGNKAHQALKSVQFINVISNTMDTHYVVAYIDSIDTQELTLNVSQYFWLNYPGMVAFRDGVSFDMEGEPVSEVYRYASNAVAEIGGKRMSVSELSAGHTIILTVNNGIVVFAETVDLWAGLSQSNVIKGIVEDNNPQLGYITLYSEDGKGNIPGINQLSILRTYNYVNQNKLDVFKNHEEASIDDIDVGDTVFLRLDEKRNIIAVSAVDNYAVQYARVISKLPDAVAVEFDSGIQQLLELDEGMLVIKDGRIAGYGALKNGDRVRLLLNVTNKFAKVKEITIEGDEHFITNIYRGTVAYIDTMSEKLMVQNMEELNGGQWKKIGQKGFSGIKLANNYGMYFDNANISVSKANKLLKRNEAYIAVEKDYGDQERAVVVTFRNQDDTEVLYNDSVAGAFPGSGYFKLSKEYPSFNIGEGSIIVKDGRLVLENSIAQEDMAYVVANRSYSSGEFNAGVVEIKERSDINFVQIYRARIKQINRNKDFTVESFSQLKGLTWEYSNTPKTFNLTNNTRILGDEGLINQRDFISYGEDSYKNRVVYVLSDGLNTVLISTAPFGSMNIKGIIHSITGAEIGEEGTVITEPSGLGLHDVKSYSLSEHMWKNEEDLSINILQNSIIIKDNAIVTPVELEEDDTVRIIKKDDNDDGYIIVVEE